MVVAVGGLTTATSLSLPPPPSLSSSSQSTDLLEVEAINCASTSAVVAAAFVADASVRAAVPQPDAATGAAAAADRSAEAPSPQPSVGRQYRIPSLSLLASHPHRAPLAADRRGIRRGSMFGCVVRNIVSRVLHYIILYYCKHIRT